MKLTDIRNTAYEQKIELSKQNTGLERNFLHELPDIQSHALVISGIRRCGKSTLLHQFVKKKNTNFFYLNFDDIRLIDFNKSDYELLDKIIEESDTKLLFFDEIQSAPYWELYIRTKLDQGFQVLLTGSNASLLSKELGTKLTGRHISKELYPFSFDEYCRYFKEPPSTQSLKDYLDKGGFPEYLKTGNTDVLSQLQSDILFRDISIRHGIRDVSALQRLFVYLVSNPSQKISPSRLTQTVGLKSATTVLEYISFLEAAYLLYRLPCFSFSVKSQNLSPKKIYICDPGISKTGSVSFSANMGSRLENFIFNCLRRITTDIFYYSGKNDSECDFIIKPHEQPSCIQVCWELNNDNQDREIFGLLEAMEFFNQKKGIIITFDSEDLILNNGKKIEVIPAWKWAVSLCHLI